MPRHQSPCSQLYGSHVSHGDHSAGGGEALLGHQAFSPGSDFLIDTGA